MCETGYIQVAKRLAPARRDGGRRLPVDEAVSASGPGTQGRRRRPARAHSDLPVWPRHAGTAGTPSLLPTLLGRLAPARRDGGCSFAVRLPAVRSGPGTQGRRAPTHEVRTKVVSGPRYAGTTVKLVTLVSRGSRRRGRLRLRGGRWPVRVVVCRAG